MAIRHYGVPYKGSKNQLAEWVIKVLPKGERLCDLFAGGCAVTHAALLSGKYERVLANDISDAPQLFLDAVNGKFKNERRWISREDFFRLKDSDPFIRYCWSFGNNGKDYLYSRESEPYKKAVHYGVALDDWTYLRLLCPEVCGILREALNGIDNIQDRRLTFGRCIKKALKTIRVRGNILYDSVARNGTYKWNNLAYLNRLLSCERTGRLNINANAERLNITKGDYRDYIHKAGDVVYCDIPYDTPSMLKNGYNRTVFDHAAFRQYALSRDYPVYISEYSMPEGFVCVSQKPKQNFFSANHSYPVTEKIFVQRKFADKVLKF